MSGRPDRRHLQVGRIARLLGVDRDQVAGLDEVPEEDLRALHAQMSHTLFGDAQEGFRKIAGLAGLIPGPLAAVLAEKFVPPVIAARVSEVLEPHRARDLVGRVRIGYLADIAMVLDPVRSRPVVQALPAKRIGEVAGELFGRGEHAVMAEFVNVVAIDALEAALEVATPHDLLAVVPMLEWSENLDHVVANLPDEQVRQIVFELDATELAELALALDPARFGPVVARIDVETVAEIAWVLFERDEHEAMARFAGVVTPEMLVAALDVASTRDLLEIAPFLEWNDTIDQVVRNLPDEKVAGLVDDLVAGEHWELGNSLLVGLGDEAVEALLTRARTLSAESFGAIERAGAAGRLSPEAGALLERAAAVR